MNMNTNKEFTKHMQASQTLANERIRAPQVRLIDQLGTNQGVVNTREALYKARQEGLDLVVINSQAQPWVVKICDLNKWLYEQKQAEKAKARKSRESEIVTKEIQLRPVTDDHDIQIKARNAQNFLQDNCRVKVIIKFKGREQAHRVLGEHVMAKFLSLVGTYKQDHAPVHQGNTYQVLLMPQK